MTTRRLRDPPKRDISKELTSDLSRIETSLEAIQERNPGLVLAQEFSALRGSLEVLLTAQARTMKDSFESYYSSERENIEVQGRPELSFEEYERTHKKGERRLNRSLAVQISLLKGENDRLKGLLERSGKQGDRGRRQGKRSPWERRRVKAHCQGCDFLLSRGLSTTKCRLHDAF